jgi:hypothetical protein
MPADTISFWLKPFGFFDRNPVAGRSALRQGRGLRLRRRRVPVRTTTARATAPTAATRTITIARPPAEGVLRRSLNEDAATPPGR